MAGIVVLAVLLAFWFPPFNVPHMSQQLAAESMTVERQTLFVH